jgi:hypothetical protein
VLAQKSDAIIIIILATNALASHALASRALASHSLASRALTSRALASHALASHVSLDCSIVEVENPSQKELAYELII